MQLLIQTRYVATAMDLNAAAVRSMLCDMQTVGYVRVSTDRQAEQGVSLEAQEAKIRAMATVQGAELLEVIVDGGESAKSLNRPGLQRLLALINAGKAQAVIVAKLDRLTRSRQRPVRAP
jgi:site-specific DNA recombinase